MVFSGLRYDWCLDLRRNLCIGAWHGEQYRDDLSSDMSGLYGMLSGDSPRPPAALLSAEPDDHL